METLLALRRPYFTGSLVCAMGATAWASRIFFSSSSESARVIWGRFLSSSHCFSDMMNQLLRSTNSTSAPKEEMLSTNARLMPWMAVPMSVTVTMPMTMPSVVSTERSLFARMALHEISKPSRSSVKKFMREARVATSNIQHSTSNIQLRLSAPTC